MEAINKTANVDDIYDENLSHRNDEDDDSPQIIICKHCGKKIEKTMLRGFSLICPHCGKPQNGKANKNFIFTKSLK